MHGIKDIFFHVIESCSFVHLLDVDLVIPDYYTINDITKFFDFCLYHISKYDNHVLSAFETLDTQVSFSNKTAVVLGDIEKAVSVCKGLAMPKSRDIEQTFTHIYEKHAKLLDGIFECCATKDKSLFFIFSPAFPQDILMLISYRQVWLDLFGSEANPFREFSDLDMIVFLSGYVYLFKTKNPFTDTLNKDLDANKLYILYYG